MADKLLEGDTALVTGGAAGIGKATAIALAREGARVVLTDVVAESGSQVADALTRDGHDARFIESDLSLREAPDRLFDQALAALGKISVFVHAASPPRRAQDTVMKVDDETWDRLVAVNLTAGFKLGRRIGQHMVDTKTKGRMLYLTSLHAEIPRRLPHYSASKAGMTMVMKELAYQLGRHGIRVNAIAPGAIGGGTGFKADPSLVQKIPLGRIGTGEDIATMAVALLSERFGGYVTGSTIRVDGGLGLISWFDPAE
jgi:NAD(P)-dependent dehydrogenase (short-subunit alcohol dehydrogenase family)